MLIPGSIPRVTDRNSGGDLSSFITNTEKKSEVVKKANSTKVNEKFECEWKKVNELISKVSPTLTRLDIENKV